MATRHNLCINPSLKNNLTGWDDNGADVPARVSVTGFPRSFGARYTTSTAGGFIRTATGAVTAGQQYTLSVYIKPTNNGGGTFYAEWLNSGGGVIGYTSNAYSANGGVVTRISHTGTAPSGAVNVRIITDGINFATNTTDFTAVLIEQGALQDFFDGDSAGASWDGADGNSASTLVDNVTGTVSINLGSLASSAIGIRGVSAVAAVNLGSLVTASAGAPAPPARTGSGWWGLKSLSQEWRQLAEQDASAPPVACERDGEPLFRAPDGGSFCKACGWRPDETMGELRP